MKTLTILELKVRGKTKASRWLNFENVKEKGEATTSRISKGKKNIHVHRGLTCLVSSLSFIKSLNSSSSQKTLSALI